MFENQNIDDRRLLIVFLCLMFKILVDKMFDDKLALLPVHGNISITVE